MLTVKMFVGSTLTVMQKYVELDRAKSAARSYVSKRVGASSDVVDVDGIWYTYKGRDDGYIMENHRV